MRKKRGRVSTGEFLAQLDAGPVYQEQKRTVEENLRRVWESNAKAEREIPDDLRKAGFELTSVWDLVNTRHSYVRALPILLDHLQRDYA